jgi:hypothetical protein
MLQGIDFTRDGVTVRGYRYWSLYYSITLTNGNCGGRGWLCMPRGQPALKMPCGQPALLRGICAKELVRAGLFNLLGCNKGMILTCKRGPA